MTRASTPGAPRRGDGFLVAVVVVAATGIAGGCGGVATPDYPGEPLAVLQGVVENPEGLALPPGSTAQLVWLAAIGSGDATQLAAGSSVQTALPADFTLTLYTEPPRSAVVVDRRAAAAVAWGRLVVVNDDQLEALSRGRPVRGVYGDSDEIRVAWLPGPEDARRLSAGFPSAPPLAPGFNVVLDRGDDVAPALSPITLTLRDGGQP